MRKFKKSLKKESRYMRRYDDWMNRQYRYDFENYSLKNIWNTEIWWNNDAEGEMSSWYGDDWKTPKREKNHSERFGEYL